MRTRTAATIAAATALLTLTACAGSTHHDSTVTTKSAASPPGTITTAIKAVATAYSNAYFGPDADKGYGLLSARCQAKVTKPAFAAQIDRESATYGHERINTFAVQRISGDLATVSYTYDDATLNVRAQPWFREKGSWRYDDC